MISIAFYCTAGGSGKTTLLCNFASFLANTKGKKVLVVDTDTNPAATRLIFGHERCNELQNDPSIVKVVDLMDNPGSCEISPVSAPEFGVDVLIGSNKMLQQENNFKKDWEALCNGDDAAGALSQLFHCVAADSCQDYDYVLFDCGPKNCDLNRAVLMGCDYYVIPTPLEGDFSFQIKDMGKELSTWADQLNQHPLTSVSTTKAGQTIRLAKFLGYVEVSGLSRGTESDAQEISEAFKADFLPAVHQDGEEDCAASLGRVTTMNLIKYGSASHTEMDEGQQEQDAFAAFNENLYQRLSRIETKEN